MENTNKSQIRASRLLKLVTEKYDGNKSRLARGVGMSAVQIGQWIDGTRNMSEASADKIESKAGIPSGWLSASEMDYKSEPKDGLHDRLMQPFTSGVTTDQLDDPNSKLWADVVDIRFSCGNGEDIAFHYEPLSIKQLSFESSFFKKRGIKPENAKFAYVKGDSMQPFLFEGDVFGMDVSDTGIVDGKIYAVYFAGEAMLKQIFVEGNGQLTLHSLNPNFKDKTVSELNGNGFRVLGRQFWRAG